ncbi:MAG: YhdP family protein [Pseudomonadota bacterium]
MALFAGMPPLPILILRRLAHYAAYVAGAAVIVMCLVALVLKFWFMPDVGRYRPDLEAAVSRVVGVPVRIGTLAADWQGINPRLTLGDVRLQPARGEPLVVPRVEALGSWWSLALLDVRLARIQIERPSLPLRRAADGIVYLAGIPLNTPSAPSPFPDWLLRQPRIVVRDAQLSWLDERLGAPVLELRQVRLLLENRFGRHRAGVVALPSAAASRLELRADLRGASVHTPDSWSGQLYAQASQADFGTWGRWVPWAQQSVKSGVGDLRFWLDIKRGQAVGLTGDAHLRDIALSIRQDLPDLRFASLSGRMGWGREKTAHTLFVERLRFQAPEAPPADPASLRLTLTPAEGGGFRRIEASADNLRLEAMTALTGALPLPRGSHDLIAALKPRGLVEHAQGHWAGQDDYALSLKIHQAGAEAYQRLPALSGLDALIEANQKGGRVTLAGTQFNLSWPQVFRHDMRFDKLDAQADWRFEPDRLALEFQARRLANADLEGTAHGHILLPRGGTPRVDIAAHLAWGQASAVHRYLPHKVAQDAYEWLKRALVGGHAENVRLTLKGDLRDFPFDHGGGEFRVGMRLVDGILAYAPGWPRIDGVRGELVFHDKAMSLTADTGRVLDARLGPVKVLIPDLHYTPDEVALIEGRASGATRTFLEFIRQSPVDRYTDHFVRPFSAQGDGILELKLRLPLRSVVDTTVGGAYTFLDNRVSPGADLPALEDVKGSLTFTEKAVQAAGMRMRILDMPAELDLNSQEGAGLRAQIRGTAHAETLWPHLPAVLARRLRGSAQWQARIDLGGGGQASGIQVDSDLVGLALDLPAPLGKTAAQGVPLQVRHLPGGEDGGRLGARYGGLASLRAHIPRNGEPRVNVRLGGDEAEEPKAAGLWISGSQRFLDLDAWRRLDWGAPTATQGEADDRSSPAFREANLAFNELRVLDRRLHDTVVRLHPSGKGWNLMLAGKEVAGELVTVPEAGGTRVIANFRRLAVPDAEAGAAPVSAGAISAGAGQLSGLELTAQSLTWKQRDLGEARLRMTPAKGGFQVERFLLAPPEGRLEASGLVSSQARRPTRLKLKLATQNLGRLLARFGYADAIKGGEAELAGSLGWQGGIEDFDLRSLDGDLAFKAGHGQFLKVDPGAARLIGVLSLQSLPRRINLDFRDVFSQGFAFDEIVGQVHIENGAAYTKDLRMNGPAAQIRMSGVVNLPGETQNLTLQIQPRIEDTVAVAGALLGGPAVGLGTLLANKVLKNPIGQVAEFGYTVSGTWAEPVIAKIPRTAAREPAETAR